MTRHVPAAGEKPLHWVGADGQAVEGARTVLEIVESHDGNAYRAIYTVRFEEAVYVLHAFQKRSPSGVRTAKRDVDLVGERLKIAQRDYEENYGGSKR